jgi:hypothetical protein
VAENAQRSLFKTPDIRKKIAKINRFKNCHFLPQKILFQRRVIDNEILLVLNI